MRINKGMVFDTVPNGGRAIIDNKMIDVAFLALVFNVRRERAGDNK